MERDKEEFMEKFIAYKPDFQEGVLLKATKMNELANRAFALPNLMFTGYTNGIIAGLEISVEDEDIIVSKGVFFFEREIYTLDKDTKVAYSPVNEWRYLTICYLDRSQKFDGIENHFALKLGDKIPKSSEIELCRFKLQIGAKLRFVYDDFEDMNTEFDTINLIYVPYSSKGQSTLHPKILEKYARELLATNPQNYLDQNFCLSILSTNATINAEGISTYLKFKEDIHLDKITNSSLYRKLSSILCAEKNNNSAPQKKIIQRRKIIID